MSASSSIGSLSADGKNKIPSDTQSVGSDSTPVHNKNKKSSGTYDSPMHRFTASATKMSLNLFSRIKDVGDFTYKVQSGEKEAGRPDTPPWGTVGQKESPVKIQTLEGVTALKVAPTNTNFEPISSQENNSADVQYEELHSENMQTKPQGSETDAKQLSQPEIRLETNDLLSVTLPARSTSTCDVEEAEDVNVSNSIEDHIEKSDQVETVRKTTKTDLFTSIGKEEFGDIVFTHKQKKHKKKKKLKLG